jgi:hypothetical protein|tara:strand:+ start:25933 stop:26244 length:312 start_codon:yes stop_codon:yes gene_type:complete
VQSLVHYGLHFIAPGAISWFFFRQNWRQVWLLLLMTMVIDLDHLLAYPHVFDSNRCSIGFHPLHNYWSMGLYSGLLFWKKTRILAIGLVLHIITDGIDCYWMH